MAMDLEHDVPVDRIAARLQDAEANRIARLGDERRCIRRASRGSRKRVREHLPNRRGGRRAACAQSKKELLGKVIDRARRYGVRGGCANIRLLEPDEVLEQ